MSLLLKYWKVNIFFFMIPSLKKDRCLALKNMLKSLSSSILQSWWCNCSRCYPSSKIPLKIKRPPEPYLKFRIWRRNFEARLPFFLFILFFTLLDSNRCLLRLSKLQDRCDCQKRASPVTSGNLLKIFSPMLFLFQKTALKQGIPCYPITRGVA